MSSISPDNPSQPVANTQTDSLKTDVKENLQPDDEFSLARKLSTLQVTNAATKPDSDTKSDAKDDHEHPCVCDLKLPRKPLTNEERYAKAKDYLRNESQTQANPPNKLAKTVSMSSASSDESSSSSGKYVSTKSGHKKETKKHKHDKSTTKMEIKVDSPDYEYQMLGGGGGGGGGAKTKIVGKTQKSKATSSKSTSTNKVLSAGGTASTRSGDEAESSPRKNIRWKKQPQIPIKMNRTANLRLEKGNLYCGYRPPGLTKTEEFFKKRDRRIAVAKAKAKAQAEAMKAALRGKRGAGSGVGSGTTSEEDRLAGAKCEYLRCRSYIKK